MKILITQLGRIGDMILLTPLFKAVKDKYPVAKADIICSRHNYSIVKNNPYINEKIIFEKNPIKLVKFILNARKNDYEYYMDPKDHYSTESRLLARMIKASHKIGFNRPGDTTFDTGINSDKENEGLHFIERALNVAAPLGIRPPADIPRPELFPDELSERYVRGYTQNLNMDKLVVINISASREDKMWQPEKWIEVISHIDSNKYNILVTSAPPERQTAEYICSNTEATILFKSRSMNDVISLVKASDLVITPDTSIVHVASAFNKPMLCLFNYNTTFYNKFRPLGDSVFVVRPQYPGTTKKIGTEDVLSILDDALGVAG